MNADLDYLYAHHAVGLCPEERCVTARANLAALVEAAELVVREMGERTIGKPIHRNTVAMWRTTLSHALQGRVASREGSGTP